MRVHDEENPAITEVLVAVTAYPTTFIYHSSLTSIHYADEKNVSINNFESVMMKQRIAKSKRLHFNILLPE